MPHQEPVGVGPHRERRFRTGWLAPESYSKSLALIWHIALNRFLLTFPLILSQS